jgi:hypothetical protein
MRDEGKMDDRVRSAEHGTPGSRTPHSVLSTQYSVLGNPYSVLIEIALIFAVFCIQGAWPVPDVNEPYYVGKAIHFWNPDWLRGDFFMESADTHKVFYFTFGWLSLWLKPEALCWTGRILTWLLLAWAWRRLSAAIVPRRWCSILTAALFVCLMDRCHMAGEWVVGGVEAKGFAYVFVLLGLAALVRDRWNRALLLFGVAAAFHVLVGGWAAVAAGIAWLLFVKPRPVVACSVDPRPLVAPRSATTGRGFTNRPPLRSLWPGILGGLLLSLPGLIPSLMLDWNVRAAMANEAHQIYVFERLPHHLVLTGIRPEFIARMCVLWVFWLVLGVLSRSAWRTPGDGRGEREPPLRRLRAFVAGSVVISLAGVALNGLIPYDEALAADLLRFYWFRLTDVALPLGVALEAAALVAGLGVCSARNVYRTGTRRPWLALAILIAAFHLGDRAIDRIAPPPPRSHRLADFEAWREACEWVAEPGNIPLDARFMVPRLAQTFMWYTGRSEVVSWKDVPQNATAIMWWWNRIQDIYATGVLPNVAENGTGPICAQHPSGRSGKLDLSPFPPRWYEPLSDRGTEVLKQLGMKYKADYLIDVIDEQTDRPPGLKVLYSNRKYVIYSLK